MSFKIQATHRFKKDLKRLAKKYHKIKADYEKLLDLLEKNPAVGTPIGHDCYKIRVANASVPTGKSGGFRVITLVRIEKESVILLTIYSKTHKENISEDELLAILQELGA